MKKSSLRNVLFWGLVACCSPIASCYAPENIVIEYDNAANGEVYQFDIMVLSEWGGHILPERESLYIYANQSNVYDLSGFSIHSKDTSSKYTLYYNGNNCDDASIDKTVCSDVIVPRIAMKGAGISVDESGSKMSFKPYRVFDELTIDCNQASTDDDSEAIVLANMVNEKYELGSSIQVYRCDYVSGGAIPMRETWNSLEKKSDSKTHFYVGNGDSFGVSQAASATFNDLPTPQILSLMGLNVDTFGNHNFDKRMAYLSPLIEMATSGNDDERYRYEYVATNLDDKSEGKKWLTRDEDIVTSDDSNAEALRVAFVGALDSSIFSTTKSGALGSLSIDSEMCSVINELEEAYNENARAFFILGHISTGSDSYINLMNAIFSLTKPVIGNYVSSDKTESNDYEYKCESKIVVPIERLEAEFGTRSVAKIDLSKQENKKKYAAIIDAIRLEIFEGIIGIIGEATVNPSVVAYYSSEAKQVPGYGLKWTLKSVKSFEDSELTTLKTGITQSNLVAKSEGEVNQIRESCSHTLLKGSYCEQFNLPNKDACGVDHPIYYIQIPGQGSHTLSISTKAVKRDDSQNGSGIAAGYRAQVDKIDIVPVMSSIDGVTVPVEGNEVSKDSKTIDLSNPNYKACGELLKDIDAALDNYQSMHNGEQNNNTITEPYGTPCEDYFEGIVAVPKLYTSIDSFRTEENFTQGDEVYSPSELYKSYTNCKDVFSPYIVEKTSQGSRKKLEIASSFWACMNSATSSVLCPDTKTGFVYPSIFVFDHYVASTMQEDRARTTYHMNISATGYFDYIEHAEEAVKPELGIINSGTMREGNFGALNAQKLAQSVPFDNQLQYVSVPVTALVPIIEKALAKGLSEANSDFGGFPSVTRMVIAYKEIVVEEADKNDKNDKNDENNKTTQVKVEITEIWKTDQYGVFTDLLYLRDADQSFFAKYKVNGTLIEAEFGSVPWFCKFGGELTACQNNTYKFTNIEKIDKSDESKNQVKGYYNSESFNVLTHSFLMGGGDDYRAYFGQDPEAVKSCEFNLRPAIFNYYRGSTGSFTEDGLVNVKTACDGAKSYQTIDGLSPKKLNCILYLNHFYRVGGPNESKKSRWIDDTSDIVNEELNSTCSIDSFN